MKILLKTEKLSNQITLIRTSAHRLQAVAPPQLEVAPPAVTCCKRLHRSSQRCNRPQLCPFITQARAGGETDPNSFPSLLYSPKPPPSPFLPSKHPKYPSFRSKASTFLPSLEDPSLEDLIKVLSKKPLNSVS